MPVHNREIAAIFEELADLLEIEDANPFRVRAYRNAARSVRGHGSSMADLLAQGKDLSALPGIGKDLAGKIRTIVETGRLPLLEESEAHTPAALSELMQIEGLGPRRTRTLYRQLGVENVADLERAARDGRIRSLPGFGTKTERILLERAQRFSGEEPRTLLFEAEDIAKPLIAHLERCDGVRKIVVAGSYRRCRETVGDLDILITTRKGSPVMDWFTGYEEVDEVVSKGRTRATVHLRSGMQVDLRVMPQVSFGAALHYFTGSRAHNIAVRKLGVEKGLKINEYGVFLDDDRISGKTEEEVYASVELPYVRPELREDRGEIDAARNGRLPDLISQDDIRGDLHCHTTATDGHDSLQQMVAAASERGYRYVSINDHSRHVTVANGMDSRRLQRQLRDIDRINEARDDIRVLKSIEVDILEDGSLDLPDAILRQLDFTVCAIHYRFGLSRRKQTERILRAMDNRCFNILAHPGGRRINQREAYALDLEKIMLHARENGCFLELNAQPDRLDLTDEACMMAKEIGLKVAISTDAHSTSHLAYMRFGINQARRGWLEADDVINTRSLENLGKLFQRNG